MRSLFEVSGGPAPVREEEMINVVLFAGGGGADLGIEAAGHPVHVAINHDPEAIAMHKANFPECEHHINDVWSVPPLFATRGRKVRCLWLSPDCKHFSKAKGSKPLDQKIRDLAWVGIKWARQVRPQIVFLENVEEFQQWCDLKQARDKKGRPRHTKDGAPYMVPDKSKIDEKGRGNVFKDWLRQFKALGYHIEFRELKACDYGAPTTRKRFFLVARRDGQPIVWPQPTHGPQNSDAVRAGELLPYRTAAECIDWEDGCASIFERKKELAYNTLRRVALGIKKFVIESGRPYLVQYNGCSMSHSVDYPCNAVTSRDRFGLVSPCILKNYTGVVGQDVRKALGTVTARDHHSLVAASLVRDFSESAGLDISNPAPTVIPGGQGKTRMCAAHLTKLRKGCTGSRTDEPVHTLSTKSGHHALTAATIVKQRGSNTASDIASPLHTISAQGLHHALVMAHALKYYGTAVGSSLDQPVHTVTSKARFGLVQSKVEGAHRMEVNKLLTKFLRKVASESLDTFFDLVSWHLSAGDIEIDGETYFIADVGLRMLQPRELARAQGFDDFYVLDPEFNGKPLTKTAQVRMLGNAVPPQFPAALVRANVPPVTTPPRRIVAMAS